MALVYLLGKRSEDRSTERRKLMKTRTRIVAVLLVLAGSAGIIVGFWQWQKKQYNYSALREWILSSEEEDTTERHRQNMQEPYQILSDHILLKPDQGEDAGSLVCEYRNSWRREILSEHVHTFIEIDYKVYYDVIDPAMDDDQRAHLYCYDYRTKESRHLFEEKDMIWFSIYKDQIIYACEDNEGHMQSICLCDMDGKQKRELYRFQKEDTLFGAGNFFLTDDTVLFTGQAHHDSYTKLAMLSLKTRTYKRVLSLGEDEDTEVDACYYLDNTLYVGLVMEGYYQITPDTEKIRAKRKVLSDVFYAEAIYCRENKLYYEDTDGEFMELKK